MDLPIDALDLPKKFVKFWPWQPPVVLAATRSKRYSFLLDAPTGVGKTLIAAATQRLKNVHVVYCCTTKSLQDQFLGDFPYAKLLKGRSNYPVKNFERFFPALNCEYCNHEPGGHHDKDDCYYLRAKAIALGSDVAVLNTAYFLSEANYAKAFSGVRLLVLDEFDTVENQLMGYVSVVLTQKQLERLKVDPPRYKTKFEAWVEWASKAVVELRNEITHLESQSTENPWHTEVLDDLRRLSQLRRLESKLSFFVNQVDGTWVWYPGQDRWEFKPVWVSKYANGLLWRHAQQVVGMSATILDPLQIARNTGIEAGTYDYFRMDSPFPKENHPVYFKPVANLTYNSMKAELPKLAAGIESILDKYPEDKVLCHTVSYAVQRYLLDSLSCKSRLVTHDPATAAQQLELFKKSTKPLVMLSPSMDRGVDLPDDYCRVIIICKVPYPSLGDPQIKKRVYASKDGNNWYQHKTVCTLVQMCGRGVRSATDYADTYILDQQFSNLYDRAKKIFPQWWRDSLVQL